MIAGHYNYWRDDEYNHWWIPPRTGRGNKSDGYKKLCGTGEEVAPWKADRIRIAPTLKACPKCAAIAPLDIEVVELPKKTSKP